MSQARRSRPAVGITGHQYLPPETAALVVDGINTALGRTPVVGVTSLAAGADQLFADCVLGRGGQVVAVIPASRYRATFSSEEEVANYDRLLAAATSVIEMPYDEPNEEAFWAAGQEVVRRCGRLIAVWDGEVAAGVGGTGDVVRYARDLGRDVLVVWPPGATRDRRAKR